MPHSRRNDSLRKYGITERDFQLLLASQNNVCAICKRTEKAKNRWGLRQLSVDHNHNTGKIRGLLCHECNSGLGLFNDSADRLEIAANYLRKDC